MKYYIPVASIIDGKRRLKCALSLFEGSGALVGLVVRGVLVSKDGDPIFCTSHWFQVRFSSGSPGAKKPMVYLGDEGWHSFQPHAVSSDATYAVLIETARMIGEAL